MRHSDPRLAATALLMLIASCETGGKTVHESPVVRDSAGIRIVESAEPVWQPGEQWRLTDEPLVQIGVLEGDQRYQLFQVRDAARLPDGSVTVANAGTGEILLYDATGAFVVRAGGKGEGPGEFTGLAAVMAYRGDSIVGWDGALRRLTVFTKGLDYVRDITINTGNSSVGVEAVLPDGSLLVEDWLPSPGRTGSGLREDSLLYLRYSPEGTELDSLGRYPRLTSFTETRGSVFISGTTLFGPRTRLAASEWQIYIGTGKAPEIEARDLEHGSRALYRWSASPQRISDADLRRYKDWRLDQAEPARRPQVERMLDRTVAAAEATTHLLIHADPTGHLWVQRFHKPWLDEDLWSWRIFDPDGRLLGDVLIPRDLTVYEVGADYVLGVARNEMDVQQVRVYGIVKPM